MKKLLLSLVLLCFMPLSAFAITCPNKPSNANIMATIHFNTTDGEGQW